jgi:hypothetical protein
LQKPSWADFVHSFRSHRRHGLPHKAVPVSKLESGAHLPASELAEAERKLG